MFLLSTMTYLPLLGALLIMLLPKKSDNLIRWVALLTTLVVFGLSIYTILGFNQDSKGYQYEEYYKDWIPSIGSGYHMGVDGVSVLMVLLNGFLFVLAIIASWKPIQTRVREYYVSMLLLYVGLMGVFCALDFFLFYIFWELVLIPMALLIGIWGGPRRVYAAVKFFLYTLVGSLLMLLAIIALYFQYYDLTKTNTLDIPTITKIAPQFSETFQFWAFLAFALAFAIKVPLWPFHTWLPDAHTEAPTAGSVILAGNMLKMGCYGFIRFNLPLFPDASKTLAPLMIGLAVIAIIYGALVAIVQPDMKRLVAYTSVSHMGFVILGLFSFAYGLRGKASGQTTDVLLRDNSAAFDGAVFTMFSHGLLTGGLFLCVGVIYDRLHTRDIKTIQDTTRVANRMPAYAAIYMLYTMGSLGLPMISGFVGEFLAMQGAFRVNGWIAFGTSFAIILAAIYMLWLYQRVIWGKPADYELATGHDDHGHGHGHATPAAQVTPAPTQASSKKADLKWLYQSIVLEPEDNDSSAAASHGTPAESHTDSHDNDHGHGHGGDKDLKENGAKFPDLNLGEWLTLYPMGIAAVVLGVFPGLVLNFLHKPAEQITAIFVNHADLAATLLQQVGK
ncbi:MAG: NADH-quinone oxidoreductase subunit M [Chloroflexota bacterium]|nr:NADH-quinone oxidoreductase subunit M [Chloroflexota bacterium]